MNSSKPAAPPDFSMGLPLSIALCALGCATIEADEAADTAGDEPIAGASSEYRRLKREPRPAAGASAAPAPNSTSGMPTDGTVIGGIVHLGAVTVDENGNITLNPGAFAPDDDGGDAVGGPSDNVGTPGTLPQLNGGMCPSNEPTSGSCAYYGDQCVYSTPSRTGYCTCIGSAAQVWSCY
jgi:hypothetical protein